MESSGKLNSNGLNLEWDGSIKPVKKGKKTQRVLFTIKTNKKHTKVDLEITPNDDATVDILGDVTTMEGKKMTKKHYDLKHFSYKNKLPPSVQRMTPQMIPM